MRTQSHAAFTRTAALAALLVASLAAAPAGAATTLTASGSYALLPLIRAAGAAYHERVPDVTVAVSENENGSRGALAQVAGNTIDFALSDVVADGFPSLVDHRLCVLGFSLIANPANGVTNLSRAQIRDIFAGNVTNWSQVGGRDLRIVAVNRPRTSGNRAILLRTVMGTTAIAESGIVEETTDATIATVRTTPGAISYAAFTGTKRASEDALVSLDGIVELAIDGVAPTEENVAAGTYPMWAYEHIYTNGPPARAVSRFLAFVASDRALLRSFGYIPIREMNNGGGA